MTTFRIARQELRALFYSPIAWLLLIVFCIQAGIPVVGDRLYEAAIHHELGNQFGGSLTLYLFMADEALLPMLQRNLYLYIPLLTMGLISRELHSGSIKLLYSSPVTIPQIVLGKFFGVLAYCFLLLSILVIYVIIGVVSVHHFDVHWVLSGMLGLFLIVSTYAAIGLFMSCLSSYQVVAAVSTLVLFGVLNYVQFIGQQFNIVRDLTYFLSITGRSDKMMRGLITSKDVIYFILIISLFLMLAIMWLQDQRQFRRWPIKCARYVFVIAVVLIVGYFSSRPGNTLYYDATHGKSQTLTSTSQQIIKQFKQPVTVTAYANLLASDYDLGFPKYRNRDQDFWERYQRFMPGLRLRYVNYFNRSDENFYLDDLARFPLKQVANRIALIRGLDSNTLYSYEEVRKLSNLDREGGRFVRELSDGHRTSRLRMFEDTWHVPGEAEITAAFKRLLVQPPCIGVVSGHGERSIHTNGDADYRAILTARNDRRSMINQGFDVQEIVLDSVSIPATITILVIADPVTALSQHAIDMVKKYIDNGGNLCLLGEGQRAHIIQPLLDGLHVQLHTNELQEKNDFSPSLITARFSPAADAIAADFDWYRTHNRYLTFNHAAALDWDEQSPFHVQPVLVADTARMASETLTVLALAMTRPFLSKTQKIFIAGDADFMTLPELDRSNERNVNEMFAGKLFNWFSDGQFPVPITREDTIDMQFGMSSETVNRLKWILLFALPGLIAGLGAYILISRNRQ